MCVTYAKNSVNSEQVLDYLRECNSSFSPILESRVDLREFSSKIIKHALIFEAWYEDELIGMLSLYYNKICQEGYINHICVYNQYRGQGVASKLLEMCIDSIKGEIILEVSNKNTNAIRLYKKYGFFQFDSTNNMLKMKRG